MFKLHERLEKDLIEIKNLELSKLMILPDKEVPWIILVPKRSDIKEWHELDYEDQKILLKEINLISNFLSEHFSPDKINVASLGNMVPQLHVHIIGRYKNDRAWPGAIWGVEFKDDHKKEKKDLIVLKQLLSAISLSSVE